MTAPEERTTDAATSGGTPATGHVFDGPGGAQQVASASYDLVGTTGKLTWQWDQVTVQPGQTVRFLHFVFHQLDRFRARQAALRGQPAPPPVALLSGGETTVTVRGSGRGGRNVEFLLSLAVELDGLPGVWALAGDTDGVDGAEEVAGAVVTPDTLARAAARGVDAKARLADNDGHGFFEALGDQVVTGPTLTNVNDFRAVLVLPPLT